MWCKQCRQDVPGAGAAEEGKFCCPRCGDILCTSSDRTADAVTKDGRPDDVGACAASSSYDGWELDQQLRHIERVLDAGKQSGRQSKVAYQREVARLDPPHAGPSARHVPPAARPLPVAKPAPVKSESAVAPLIWVALSLGTMTFVCGLILLGWSLVAGRDELWSVGMPVALCGQIALLVGLVLQLDRLWHDSRHAAAKLDDVDERLRDLKTATTMLETGHGSPGSAFYSHLADGAGPQLLLTDLKSQLDLLAVKIMQKDE